MRQLALAVLLLLVACGRSPDRQLAVDPSVDRVSLTFVVEASDVPAAQAVAVTSGEIAGLPWRLESDRAWLRVGPSAGTTPAVVSVSVDTAGVAPGAHTGVLRFDFGEPTFASREVVVYLTLTAPGWSLTDGPFGGTVSALAARGERVVAGDPYGTLWLSTDGGRSFAWLASLGGVIAGLHLGEAMSYALSETTGLWRSSDGGASWAQTAMTGGVAQLHVRAGDDDVIYVRGLGSDAVARSTDAGASWSNLPLNGRAFCVAGGPVDPTELLVCGDGWTADATSDDGASWRRFEVTALYPTAMLRSSSAPSRLLIAGRDGTLARSDDDGATFRRDALGVPMGTARALEELGGAYWLASSAGLGSSGDGVVFTSAIGRPLPIDDFSALAHTGEGLLAGHAALGVLRDAPALVPASGLLAHRVHSLSVDPLDGRVLAATDRSGLWELAAGAAWSPIAEPSLFPSGAVSTQRVLARDPADRARLLLATCPGGVLSSPDGGASFGPSGANSGDCVRGLAWDWDDPQIVYAANGRNLLRSVDRGVTFQLMRGFDGDIRALMPLPGGDVVVFHWYRAAWRWSAGGGWQSLGLVGDFTHVAVRDDGSGFVAGADGVHAYDGGAFSLIAPPSPRLVGGLVVRGDEVFFARDGGPLLYSPDGGGSWSDMGCPSTSVTALQLDGARRVLWVATADLGVLAFAL